MLMKRTQDKAPVKQVSQASEQSLLGPLILGFILQDLISEWLAEVQRL